MNMQVAKSKNYYDNFIKINKYIYMFTAENKHRDI